MHSRVLIAMGAICAAACGGDVSDKAAATTGSGASAMSADDYRKAQERIADSVLSELKGADQVVRDLGMDYEVGGDRLRDSIAVLATRSNCFLDGRKSDPYLAGTVSFHISMSTAGTDAIQVQENATKWTSTAGNIVNSCLNLAARDWKFDTSFGKPASYIAQVRFK